MSWDVVLAEQLYTGGTRTAVIAVIVGAPSATALRAAACRRGWVRKARPEKGPCTPRQKRPVVVTHRCYRCRGQYQSAVNNRDGHGCNAPGWHSIYVSEGRL